MLVPLSKNTQRWVDKYFDVHYKLYKQLDSIIVNEHNVTISNIEQCKRTIELIHDNLAQMEYQLNMIKENRISDMESFVENME